MKTLLLLGSLLVTTLTFGQIHEKETIGQYFYAVVITSISDVKDEDLVKKNGIYEITDEAYDRLSKERNVIFISSFNDVKRAKQYRRSQISPSSFKVVKVDNTRLKASRPIHRRSINEYLIKHNIEPINWDLT